MTSTRSGFRTVTFLLAAVSVTIFKTIFDLVYLHSLLPDRHSASFFTTTVRSLPQQRKTSETLDNNILQLWNRNSGMNETTVHQVVKKDREGNVVHRSITAIKATDLSDAVVPGNSLTMEEASMGREPLLQVLQEAGVQEMEAAAVAQLPTWEQVSSLYYQHETPGRPVVVGLDTCEAFRQRIPSDQASVGVAGLFNTGTNPAAMYLSANCVMPDVKKNRDHGMRWQVPWGKHMVADRKWNNTAKHDTKVNKTTVLPVVFVRDPYSWMQSMCKHPYAAKWEHSETHCPNLVEDDGSEVPVSVKYPGQHGHWDSLVHLWSDWYRQYFQANYPRLMVRFEDLIFRPKELVSMICDCAGAVAANDHFTYVVDAGKWGSSVHAGSSNMISAMVKYGTGKNRFKSMTDSDRKYASQYLDGELMRLFQYEIPPIIAAD